MENNFTSSNARALTVAVVVLLFGLVISFLYVRRQPAQPSPSPSSSAEITPTLEVVKSVLLGKALIKFPDTASSLAISINQLPKDLNVFLFDNSTNLSVKTVKYTDGAKGYQIEYTANLPWRDINNKFINLANPSGRSSWSLVAGRLAELFGFVEMENNQYQVRVDQSFNNNQSTLVLIQIISK